MVQEYVGVFGKESDEKFDSSLCQLGIITRLCVSVSKGYLTRVRELTSENM
jgi:hypothetical protein